MPYVNANPNSPRLFKRLAYYIIVDGQSNASLTCSYHAEKPIQFIANQHMRFNLALQWQGVNFVIYASEIIIDRELLYCALYDVLSREGLI